MHCDVLSSACNLMRCPQGLFPAAGWNPGILEPSDPCKGNCFCCSGLRVVLCYSVELHAHKRVLVSVSRLEIPTRTIPSCRHAGPCTSQQALISKSTSRILASHSTHFSSQNTPTRLPASQTHVLVHQSVVHSRIKLFSNCLQSVFNLFSICFQSFDCLRSNPPLQTRIALYQAAGLGPSGEYRDCRLAGRVLVGANSGAGSGPITLLVLYNSTAQRDTLIIPDPFK